MDRDPFPVTVWHAAQVTELAFLPSGLNCRACSCDVKSTVLGLHTIVRWNDAAIRNIEADAVYV